MNKLTAKYPSNIALVKYWGKFGNQLPCNASLSLTLTESFTETTLTIEEKTKKDIELSYLFEGKTDDSFRDRVLNYILSQKEFSELLQKYSLKFSSKNSFPHSTGIASSASAYAAIAALLLKASGFKSDNNDFNQKASFLARLGSGSASRSFYGPYSLWGELENVTLSNNEYAIPVNNVHKNFRSMCDAILVVEDSPKKVSSSTGHALMNDHPYAKARFRDAQSNCLKMLEVLKSGDYEAFIAITEIEALSLHAMMMTSKKYYLLFQPDTIWLINQIIAFREDTKLPICFTLDAGPNIHLIYPSNISKEFYTFVIGLKNKLKTIIFDKSGEGGLIY